MTEFGRLVKQHGAKVSGFNGLMKRVIVDAPVGYVWACRGVHALVGRDYTSRARLLAGLVEHMRLGVVPCGCDACKNT